MGTWPIAASKSVGVALGISKLFLRAWKTKKSGRECRGCICMSDFQIFPMRLPRRLSRFGRQRTRLMADMEAVK